MAEARPDDEGIRVVLAGEPQTAAQINAELVRAGLGVTRLEPVRQSLEQRFLQITSRLDADLAPRGGEGMSPAIAIRMVGADFLKLRKKRGTLIWALVLALAPLLIFFVVKALQHSSSPAEHSPAGGIGGFTDALRVLAFVLRAARRDHDRHRRRRGRPRGGSVPRSRRDRPLAPGAVRVAHPGGGRPDMAGRRSPAMR